jgi:predicted transcriptional regulator
MSKELLTPERFLSLKRQVEQLRRKADQGQGALKQMLERLKAEHEVSSAEDGRKLLEKLGKQEAKLAPEAEKTLDAWEAEYGDKI